MSLKLVILVLISTLHLPKQRPITVDEVIPMSVPDSGDIATEHCSQHGIWVTLQRRQRSAVHTATNIKIYRLPHLDIETQK